MTGGADVQKLQNTVPGVNAQNQASTSQDPKMRGKNQVQQAQQ